MLAMRNGGICMSSFSRAARRFEARLLAAAKPSMNALSFGSERVARTASFTMPSTPSVMYFWISKFLLIRITSVAHVTVEVNIECVIPELL